MVAAFAAAALFHWARALANAACPAGAVGEGVGDAVAEAEPAGAVDAMSGGVVEADAVSACGVLGVAAG
jgi:hypothetical protein